MSDSLDAANEPMWAEWLRRNYRTLLLFFLLLLFMALYLMRRLMRIEDPTQTEFLNDCAKICLGAVIGVLSERAISNDK